ncbi:MAG: DUF503 domain-containing protein [Thermomicrobiaceae bacterium]
MVVAIAYLVVEIPESHSLKEKRSTVRPVIKRVQSRFNVSIAEIDNLENWQVAGIGIVCVSNAKRHAEEMIQNVVSFVEEGLRDGYLAEVETDTVTF